MLPLTYRQLQAALNELDEEQLDMTVTVMDECVEFFCVYDTYLVSELPKRIYEEQDMEDNQPILDLRGI